MRDGAESSQYVQQKLSQQCCVSCFSLPPSRFCLGLQSFSIHDGYPAGTAPRELNEHQRTVQRLQRQCSSQPKKSQHEETSWKQLIAGQLNALQPHVRGQQRKLWHDQQWPQQALRRDHHGEDSEHAEVPLLSATLLPASTSPIASRQNAKEDTELPLRAGRPAKGVEEAEAREDEEAQLAACEAQVDAAPALLKKAGFSPVDQLKQPAVHRYLLGEVGKDDGATAALHSPTGATAQRREEDVVEESARHQVASRFQVIKRLRHPHLCAYTHMLRRGRRIYVVSEYWSVSLADLLNQQLQSQMRKSRRETAGSIDISPCRCGKNAINFKGNSVGACHSGTAESRSSSTTPAVSAIKECCGDCDGGCSSTKETASCSDGEPLPLIKETFLRRIVRQTLSALEYLNSRSIVHGRLSLSAIRFDAEGNVRLADWGLHYLTAHGRCSPHTQIHPPLPFIPPETLLVGPPVAATPPSATPAAAAATPALPTGSAAAVAAMSSNASAVLSNVRPGCTCDSSAVASGVRLNVPAAPETAAKSVTPDVRVATHCWLHSNTGDVFSLGIILLHLLQGPPRTPMPHELLDTLRRHTAQQQQQQPVEVRFTRGNQTAQEAKRDKKQQRGQVGPGWPDDESKERRKRREAQHETLTTLQSSLAQGQQQQSVSEQQLREQQAKSRITVARQEQGYEEFERHESCPKEDDKPSIHGEQSPAEEISIQPLQGSPAGRSSAEEAEEGEEENRSQPGSAGLYWDEWEGYERTKLTRKFETSLYSSSSAYSSESELNGDDMLSQGPACSLHYLRQVERIALLLLYVHCGYEAVQKNLPFLPSAAQEERRTRTQDKLNTKYTDRKKAADEMLHAQAPATSPTARATMGWAEKNTVCLAGAPVARNHQRASIIGSCIGQGLKQFWRQQQHHLLESMRCLLRGPCSVTFRSETYEILLKVMVQYIQVRKLRQCRPKHPLQQARMQEVLVMPTGGFPVLSDDREKAGWLAPQHALRQVTWQQMASGSLALNKHENGSLTQGDACVCLNEAEDILLDFVLSAAVEWLSGTNIWPAHVRTLLRDNTASNDAPCFLRDNFCSSGAGVQTTASASESDNQREEHMKTEAGLEPRVATKTQGMVSQELRDFLCLCLSLSPNDRPTPAEALNSAWLHIKQETATSQVPFDPHGEQQRHRRRTPVQHGRRLLPCSKDMHAGGGNMPLHSSDTTVHGQETEWALWCPQPANSAVTLLQQLQMEDAPRTPTAAGVLTHRHGTDDIVGDFPPVNMQTLLQRNYGVPVEEVFYWWQLLGHDVHSTLTSMGAFRPVSSCLRIPLASIRTTDLATPAAPRDVAAVHASPIQAVSAVGDAIATKARESGPPAAVNRDCLQRKGRQPSDLDATDGPSWTDRTGADGNTAGTRADGSSSRQRLGASRQRRRIPFLLPFADLWGQLHGPAKHDSDTGRKTVISNDSTSSTSKNSGTFRGNGSTANKQESWDASCPIGTGACDCARDAGWARLSSPRRGRERFAPAATPRKQEHTRYGGNCNGGEHADSEGLGTAGSLDSNDLGRLTGGESFPGETDISGRSTNPPYNKGKCSTFSANSVASEYLAPDELTADPNEATPYAVKYTIDGKRDSNEVDDGSVVALANVTEASSFFACGLQNDGRKWTSTGFIWKEGDARIRGVELADVMLALDAADRVPLSKAEEEAAVDIPPLLRPEIWAALLDLNYAAEAGAGPFLFDQLMLEASALPATNQLESVKFFGCHEYHDILGSVYGATNLRRLLQAFLVQELSPPRLFCTSSTFPAGSSYAGLRPSFQCTSGSRKSSFRQCESLDALHVQPSRSTSPSRDMPLVLEETADPVLLDAKPRPQLLDMRNNSISLCVHGVPILTKARLVAPEQVRLSAQGLDALAAPLLLLYENYPHLALCSLQRFLLRNWQHQPLLTPTPCTGSTSVACEMEGRNDQDDAADNQVHLRRNIMTESIAGEETNPAGRKKATLGFAEWSSVTASALQNQLQCYSQLLAFVDPVVAAHLSNCIGLKPEMYVVPWLMTSFSHALELHQLYILWDTLLLRPPGFVLCVAVCLVHFLRVALLKLAVDDELAALSLLQNAPAFVHIPALSASAGALQDAIPPSILCSSLGSIEAAQTPGLPAVCAACAGTGARSLTPSLRSEASARSVCARPTAALQQLAHERQTGQDGVHRGQQHRRTDDLAEPDKPAASHSPRACAAGIGESRPEHTYPTPLSICKETTGEAAGNCEESLWGADRVASATKSVDQCHCTTAMSLGQAFYISGSRIGQDADRTKENERMQNVEDACDSESDWQAQRADAQVGKMSPGVANETLVTNQPNPPGGAAALHLLSHERNRKVAKGYQCKLTGEDGRGNKRLESLLCNGRNMCKSGRASSMPYSLEGEVGRKAKLQRALGDTAYAAHEIKHGVHARARAVVAAVIKGPALMLVGSPRKIWRRGAILQETGARPKARSLSALLPGPDAAEPAFAAGHRNGEAQQTLFRGRVDGDSTGRPDDVRDRWEIERQAGNARTLPRIRRLQGAELRNACPESRPPESTAPRELYISGLPSLTSEEYLNHADSITVLDVRSPSSFSRIHLLDAVNLPVSASSAQLLTALEPAAAAAAAIEAPFPTLLFNAGPSGNDKVQSSRARRADLIRDERGGGVCQKKNLTSAESGCETTVNKSGCLDAPSAVAPWGRTGLEERPVPQVNVTADKPGPRDVSVVSGARPPFCAAYDNWPACQAHEITQSSHPWIKSGMQRLHLVMVMGETMQSAAELASRLRNSGIPHVCVLRNGIEALCKMPARCLRGVAVHIRGCVR